MANDMTSEEYIEHLKDIPRIRKICEGCEHGDQALEFEGVDYECICKQSQILPEEMSPEEVEVYGTDLKIYRGPEDLKRCPIGKW